MAPKTKVGELPKAALEYKEMLQAMAGGVTPDNVKSTAHQARGKAISAMKGQMTPEKLEEFKSLDKDSSRQEWLAEYLLDPASGGCVGKNFCTRTSTTSDTTTWVWLTLDELAGPKWLNSEANAKIAITAMTSRPHSTNTALCDAGVHEYRHEIRKEELKKAIDEGARLENNADMSARDYSSTYKHMANSMNPGQEDPRPSKKARAGKEKVEKPNESPEKVSHKALCIQ